MKVALTGSSGGLGSLLLADISIKHDVVTLGRNGCDISWSLGVLPSPDQLRGIDAIIHCAWSTKNRAEDSHINVGGTNLLASFAEAMDIPFLFLSTVAAESNSYYGKAKNEAEILVRSHGGSILRIGLVPESNPYLKTKKKFFGLAPKLTGTINVTDFNAISSTINNWLNRISLPEFKPDFETKISSNVGASEQFSQQYQIAVPLPFWILKSILRIGAPISTKSSNLLDALNSLTTTPITKP